MGSVLTVFLGEWGNKIEKLIAEHPFFDSGPRDEAKEAEIIEDLVGKATVMIQDKGFIAEARAS
ncbi:hypothetical protein ACSHUI_10330 [Bacillus subtilis]|uniref:hypothetical protein n=1 Tax=Bacillus subtilis TaxID=1423 RepID=UPI0023EBD2B7|nr:hypothetical protein [Bacillus subtilis]MDF4198354.1 hypothetical protein [Bacillus subtilis]GLI88058.1 hypothetical protein ANABIO4_14100 [Bacillus subtilis]